MIEGTSGNAKAEADIFCKKSRRDFIGLLLVRLNKLMEAKVLISFA